MNYENMTCGDWLRCTLESNTPIGIDVSTILLIGIGLISIFYFLFNIFSMGSEEAK